MRLYSPLKKFFKTAVALYRCGKRVPKKCRERNYRRPPRAVLLRSTNPGTLKRAGYKLVEIFAKTYETKNVELSEPVARRREMRNLLGFITETLMITIRIIVITSVASVVSVLYVITRFLRTDIFPTVLLKATEYLGPIFIKFGQWISTRRDLFPEDICDTLSQLQRCTSVHSWLYTRSLLEATYGNEWRNLFVQFHHERPIGSGCCAQVYKAWINPGYSVKISEDASVSYLVEIAEYFGVGRLFELVGKPIGKRNNVEEGQIYSTKLHPVAVKVLHPGIEEQLKRDLGIMHVLAKCITCIFPSVGWLSLVDCVSEFSQLMESQVNMELEAFNLARFSKNFSKTKNVIFPYPYRGFTHQKILVESYHDGLPISNYLFGKDRELQERLAKIGVTTVLKMIFKDNFVHCDLHPGNILVQESSESRDKSCIFGLTNIWRFHQEDAGPRLVILDCGLVASLNERCRKNLHDVFRSVAMGKGELAAEYIMRHSIHLTPDPLGFKRTMGKIVETHLQNRVKLKNVNVSTVVAELFSAMIRYQVKQDGSFSSVILSMAVIEGLGRSLDPDIDIVNEVLPYVRNYS